VDESSRQLLGGEPRQPDVGEQPLLQVVSCHHRQLARVNCEFTGLVGDGLDGLDNRRPHLHGRARSVERA
jgi:hypothetical protein